MEFELLREFLPQPILSEMNRQRKDFIKPLPALIVLRLPKRFRQSISVALSRRLPVADVISYPAL